MIFHFEFTFYGFFNVYTMCMLYVCEFLSFQFLIKWLGSRLDSVKNGLWKVTQVDTSVNKWFGIDTKSFVNKNITYIKDIVNEPPLWMKVIREKKIVHNY